MLSWSPWAVSMDSAPCVPEAKAPAGVEETGFASAAPGEPALLKFMKDMIRYIMWEFNMMKSYLCTDLLIYHINLENFTMYYAHDKYLVYMEWIKGE